MSCFPGRMREYVNISIDRFDGPNVTSTVFLLSHCHRDHMVGLELMSFQDRLKSRNDIFLYCSRLTKTLLLSEPRYKALGKYVRVLDVNAATTITVPDRQGEVNKTSSVLLTALPAGHCPGSVMFLLEGKEGTVLYTGDFRWEMNHAKSLAALKSGDSVKEIKSLYIDTTFCFEDAFHFPSRGDCVDAASDLVKKWLDQSADNVVSISCKAKYGYEHFLQELSNNTGHKVHTSAAKCSVYKEIGELADVFTQDPSVRIHACDWTSDRCGQSKLPCGYHPGDNREVQVLALRPSTMFFALQRPHYRHNDLIVYPKSSRGLHRVCYSFHSSYTEIRDLVMYLQPQRVFPNVRPPNESDMSKVQARLNGFLKMLHLDHIPTRVNPNNVLGKLKVRRTMSKNVQSSQSDSEGLNFGTQDIGGPEPMLPFNAPLPQTPTKDGSQSVGPETPAKSELSLADSSYQGSVLGEDQELDLTNSQEDETKGVARGPLSTPELMGDEGGGGDLIVAGSSEDSCCLYVSGDEDCEEEDRLQSVVYQRDPDDVVNHTLSQPLYDEVDAAQARNTNTAESVQGTNREDSVQDLVAGKSEDGECTLIVNSKDKDIDESSSAKADLKNGKTCFSDSNKVSSKSVNILPHDSDDVQSETNDQTELKSSETSKIPNTDSGNGDIDKSNNSADVCKEDCAMEVGESGENDVIVTASESPNKSVEEVIITKDEGPSSKRPGAGKGFSKTTSFDLFDEGHVTDVEDNADYGGETQEFDVDLVVGHVIEGKSQAGHYVTEIDPSEERRLREVTAQMLLRLQGDGDNSGNHGDAEDEIVILDSDSDTESGFLSAGRENKANQGKEYANGLNSLITKVEKRLASSDSEFSPSKKIHLDLSRNCESDSDMTLPPSQGSSGRRHGANWYYDSVSEASSESDIDPDEVEILFETDADGTMYDVLGNEMKSDHPRLKHPAQGVVKKLVETPSTSKHIVDDDDDDDVIDLTGEEETVLKPNETEADVKQCDTEIEMKPSDTETDVKQCDTDTDVKQLDTDVKQLDTDMKSYDTETEMKSNDTDMKSCDTDAEMKSCDTDDVAKPCDKETNEKLCDAKTDTEHCGTDTDMKSCDTDDDSKLCDKVSEGRSCDKIADDTSCDTEPDHKSCDKEEDGK